MFIQCFIENSFRKTEANGRKQQILIRFTNMTHEGWIYLYDDKWPHFMDRNNSVTTHYTLNNE